MSKKSIKLEQRRLFLSKRIEDIKNRQNELMLRNVLLNSRREELESKRYIIERLIANSTNEPTIRKQIIPLQINNIALPKELFMN